MHEDKRSIDYCRNDGDDVPNVARSHALANSMRVGDLVRSRHDHSYHGIVVEIDPQLTRLDHPKAACRVQWCEGDMTYEFIKMLEILSESR